MTTIFINVGSKNLRGTYWEPHISIATDLYQRHIISSSPFSHPLDRCYISLPNQLQPPWICRQFAVCVEISASPTSSFSAPIANAGISTRKHKKPINIYPLFSIIPSIYRFMVANNINTLVADIVVAIKMVGGGFVTGAKARRSGGWDHKEVGRWGRPWGRRLKVPAIDRTLPATRSKVI